MTHPQDVEPAGLKLAPCPFCGGEAVFSENQIDYEPVWGVRCDGKCFAWIDACTDTKAEAAEVWNTRASPSLTGEWVLVPREPTEAMVEGAANYTGPLHVRKNYRAMIAASPSPSGAESERASSSPGASFALVEAAREAGWALMENVDAMPWERRAQVVAIAERLAGVLSADHDAARSAAWQKAAARLRRELEPFANRSTGSIRIDMDDVRLILAALPQCPVAVGDQLAGALSATDGLKSSPSTGQGEG